MGICGGPHASACSTGVLLWEGHAPHKGVQGWPRRVLGVPITQNAYLR